MITLIHLKSLSQSEEKKSTIIIVESGIVEVKMILFDGEIITIKAKNKK